MVNIGRSGMWRPAVQPWVERVAAALAEGGKSTHSVCVEIEGVRIMVTPLEQQLALSVGDDEGAGFARKHILVRDCLGLRVKMACALVELERAGQPDTAALEKVLAADVDLGCELMHELTLEMKDISSAGSLNEAKELSQYRKQLLLLVEQAERRVGVSVDRDAGGPVPSQPAARPRAGSPNPARRPRATPAPRSSPRTGRWPMWVALALLGVLAAAIGVTLYLGR